MGTIFVSMMDFCCKLVSSLLLFVDKRVNEHDLRVGRIDVVGLAILTLAGTFIDLDTARLCQIEIAKESFTWCLQLLRWVSFDLTLDELTLIHNDLVTVVVLFIFENSDICFCRVPRLT